jgi:hypothetical protein
MCGTAISNYKCDTISLNTQTITHRTAHHAKELSGHIMHTLLRSVVSSLHACAQNLNCQKSDKLALFNRDVHIKKGPTSHSRKPGESRQKKAAC